MKKVKQKKSFKRFVIFFVGTNMRASHNFIITKLTKWRANKKWFHYLFFSEKKNYFLEPRKVRNILFTFWSQRRQKKTRWTWKMNSFNVIFLMLGIKQSSCISSTHNPTKKRKEKRNRYIFSQHFFCNFTENVLIQNDLLFFVLFERHVTKILIPIQILSLHHLDDDSH